MNYVDKELALGRNPENDYTIDRISEFEFVVTSDDDKLERVVIDLRNMSWVGIVDICHHPDYRHLAIAHAIPHDSNGDDDLLVIFLTQDGYGCAEELGAIVRELNKGDSIE